MELKVKAMELDLETDLDLEKDIGFLEAEVEEDVDLTAENEIIGESYESFVRHRALDGLRNTSSKVQ